MQLQEYIESKKLTYRSFSQISGVDKARISKIARRVDYASMNEADAIAKATQGAVSAASMISEKNREMALNVAMPEISRVLSRSKAEAAPS